MQDTDVMMRDEIRELPLDQIVEPWAILRTIDREAVEYLELRDSLADEGLLNSICVRPSIRTPGKMEVVDGLRRFTAARDLQLPSLSCIIKFNLTDEDVLAIQIQANALRAETTPVEYARQLKRIMTTRPGMTVAELSNLVHKNSYWIGEQLGLLGLRRNVQNAVERGEIPLGSAYVLARLPWIRQDQFLALARTVTVKEFAGTVAPVIKAIKEAARQGKLADFYMEVQPNAYLRSLKDIQVEYEGHQLGGLMVAQANCRTLIDAWYLALQWVLNLDDASICIRREKMAVQLCAKVLIREDEPCNLTNDNDPDSDDDNDND